MAIGRPISLTPNIATKAINSVATANQTDFTVTGGYRINELAVYRNGVRLAQGRDFTANDGTTVTLTNGATVNDVIEFVVFDSFNVADAIVSVASSQTVSGDLNVTGKFYSGSIDPNSLNAGVGTFNTQIHVGSALTADASGNLNTVGVITASSFSGDGSSLTNVSGIVTANIVSVAITTKDINVSAAATITGDLTVSDSIAVTKDINIGAAATITGALSGSTGTFSGAVNVDATTDSTSSSTGALIVDGGLGVAKNVYIGAGLSVAGTLTYEDVTNVDSVGLITAKSGVNVSGGQLLVGSGITMGIAGVATFSGTSDVHLLDNVQLNVGDGSDLKLYHDGTNSAIQNATGNLYVYGGTNNVYIRPVNGEDSIIAKPNNGVDIYYDNSKKFETSNDGTVVTGIATATVGIDAAISVWTLGASGTDHYTFTGPGNLSATSDPTLNLKRGQKYTFKNRSGGHPFRIQSTPNGSAGTAYNTGVTNNDGGDGTNIIFDVPYNAPNVLYYQCTSHGNMGGAMYIDGSAYEISVGSGVTIGSAGVTTFSGTSDVHLLDSVRLNVGDSSDLSIYHDGSHSYLTETGTGALKLKGDDIRLENASGNNIIKANTNVAELFNNGNKKFETTNDGVVVTGVSTATQGFRATNDGNSDIDLKLSSGSTWGLRSNATSGTNAYGFEIYKGFAGTDTKFSISTDGDVGINVTPTSGVTLQIGTPNSATGVLRAHPNYFSIDSGSAAGGGVVGSATTAALIFGGDSNTGLFHSASDTLNFTTGGSERLRITSGGDVEFYGTAAGITSAYWDASANSLIFKDDSYAKFGDGVDLAIYHDGDNSYVSETGTGSLILNTNGTNIKLLSDGSETMAKFVDGGAVELYYNNSKKWETTNDGTVTTGITTTTAGAHFQGMLREDTNIVANKLSAATNINLEDGMIHYFSTNETTTATPNVRFSSSKTLNNMMSVGETVTVTIIYKPNGAGYYAQLTIDGSGETEKWNGGAAPSAANASGFDVLTHNITKTGNAAWMILSNVQNYA